MPSLVSKLWIGGEWTAPASGASYRLEDPASGEAAGEAPQAGPADVARAVAAATRALPQWRAVDPWKRAQSLRRIASAIADRREELAQRMAREIGKPLDQGRGEVQVAIDQFDWYADETRRIFGEIVESRTAGQTHLVRYQPVGIVAAFSPWNFPVALVARKLAPALAAGCAVIARPAEEAPATAALLFECIEQGALPAGTANLLNGIPSEITPALLASPAVCKVSFTGSVGVGKMLARASSDTLKKVTLELGGHAPVLVFDDADIEHVVRLSVQSKFRNAGQICVSPTRFFVQRSIKARFEEAFVALVRGIRVGPPGGTGIDMGPLATRRRFEQVQSLVDDAVERKARILAGGGRVPDLPLGNYFQPTVLADVPDGARVLVDEPFGPVAVVNAFDDAQAGYALANATSYGLAAYAFTRSLKTAMEASERLDAGVVSINTFMASTTEIPFGGTKESGYGRECGSHGIREYLEAKTINLAY